VTDRGAARAQGARRGRRGGRGLPRTPSVPDPVGIDGDEALGERDPLGRMALFSSTELEPARSRTDVLALECSSCLAESPVSPSGLLRAALPLSVHLPLVKRYHSFMRCPACGRRAWLRLVVRS
jgi:hypothetical protein